MAIPEIRLSPEDKQTLVDLEADVIGLEREITRAERAGLDVTELRAKFDESKKLREGILREYG